MKKPAKYDSVWDALADTPEEAANLRARAELMRQIAAIVKKNGWTQAEAAQRCGITQERLADILQVNQAAISKMEKRSDMYLSTLRSYVEAMGGHLDIRAVFPDGEIMIEHLSDAEDRELVHS